MLERTDSWNAALAERREPKRVPKAVLRLRMCAVLMFLDLFAIAVAFLLASRMPFLHAGAREASMRLIMLSPIFVVVALLNRAYSPRLVNDCWMSVGRALRSLMMSISVIVVIVFFLNIGESWSRASFASGIGLSMLFLFAMRYAFGRHARFLIGGEPYEVLVIHDGPRETLPEYGAVTLATLPDEAFDPSSLSPAGYDRFAREIEFADRVVVHCPVERRHYWAQALKGADVQGELVTPEFVALAPMGCGSHVGQPTLVVTRGPLGLKDRLIKRAFDIVVAGLALLVLAPLMLAVALVIRLQDGGPVFFRQKRVGRSNRQFMILKFRSMNVATEDAEGNRSASRADDRITRFGRFIRTTSIDELPQLINVLRGDMSVVGPRPHALGSTAENELFWHIDERYWQRHAIRPGLTGLAQVRGFRGATNSKADLVNRLQSDLEYLRTWTIWRDLMILIRTLNVILHKNAY
ncbi:MAG: exopolysaccharide biosynthesis polyprenyl glycosylphosphotransferase [Novosphingobium sp.]